MTNHKFQQWEERTHDQYYDDQEPYEPDTDDLDSMLEDKEEREMKVKAKLMENV